MGVMWAHMSGSHSLTGRVRGERGVSGGALLTACEKIQRDA